jgi:hypothetical protein
MLNDRLRVALKEWAVVQRSLLEGRQIMLVRKGGIVEESGDFDLRADQFLIMPTYIHQTERAGDVQPAFGDWLAEEESRRAGEDSIRFEAACEVVDVVRVRKVETLTQLAQQHIWSEQFLRGRFDWEPYKPVFVLLVRAYALPGPVVAPNRPEYGGCKSWIELAEPISAVGAIAAIADDSFARRLALTKNSLG